MNVSGDTIPDLSRLFQPTNDTIESTSTSNGHSYALINTNELVNAISKICEEKVKLRLSNANISKKLSKLEDEQNETQLRLNDEMLLCNDLQVQVQEFKDQVPHPVKILPENKAITFLRKYELLIGAVTTTVAAAACFFFPLYSISFALANGACISFVRFLVLK